MKIIKRFLYLSAFVLLLPFASLYAQNNITEKIDLFIKTAMKDWDVPGLSVSVVKNDSIIFSKGFGVREYGKTEPVDENTLFVIASCSKAFTTAALAILVDNGKINWDDPVIKYLPGFQMYDPWVTNEITIRDLVTHRSGLATFSGDFLWINSTYNMDEIIKRAKYLQPTSSFRTKYGYQNIMYITAAQIIKAVTDTTWADFVKSHFLNKIGMRNSNTSYVELVKAKNYSKSHFTKDGAVKVYYDTQIDNAHGALGINSSAHDMAQWIRLQLGKGKYNGTQIFSEAQSNEMFSNHMFIRNMNYGLGWFIRYTNGKRTINHGGGMPGMISDVTLVPENNLGLVILSNHDAGSGLVTAVKNYILDLYAGVEPKDYSKIYLDAWNKRIDNYEKENQRREEVRIKDTKPSLPLNKYCGIFEDKMYGKLEITLKDENLFMQFKPSPTFRGVLKHYHYDTFYIEWEDEFLTRGWVKFEMDFEGTPNKILIEVPNSPDFIFTELLFEKIKE